MLQGDKIETPEYIQAHDLKPDYEYYISNQIMKPVSQIYGLCLEKLPRYNQFRVDFEAIYDAKVQEGKTEAEALKKVLEKKTKNSR